jgi:pimeloyl-ACP methyl ester carboxylesterase
MLVVVAHWMGPGPSSAQEAEDWAVGSWSGILDAGPQRLEIVFHVARGEQGALTGTMDVPAQGARGIPLTTVEASGETLSVTFPVPGGGRYEGARAGADSISGTFTQGPASFPMVLERTEEEAEPRRRPQEPEPPLPYEEEEVVFRNVDAGVELAGTLTKPRGAGPFPAAVLVSGSGPQDRDESLLGHKPFLVLADHLTREGIAVLRYDDRGVGASTGDFGSATSADFADDAIHAVRYLAGRDDVDGDRVGIVGHSEGGLVGPMAATRSDEVRFVVMLAGPGVTGIEILVEQGALIARAGGTPESLIELNASVQFGLAEALREEPDSALAAEAMRQVMRDARGRIPAEYAEAAEAQLTEEAIEASVQRMNTPWFRAFLDYDPRPALEGVRVPVLALFGEKDLQVPPEQSASEVEAAFRRGGNPDATVRVLPGLNHLFQRAETGSPTEYENIEETMNPDLLEAVSGWIRERFGVDRQ